MESSTDPGSAEQLRESSGTYPHFSACALAGKKGGKRKVFCIKHFNALNAEEEERGIRRRLRDLGTAPRPFAGTMRERMGRDFPGPYERLGTHRSDRKEKKGE